MPRLRQVPRKAADPFAQKLYKMLFGDRNLPASMQAHKPQKASADA